MSDRIIPQLRDLFSSQFSPFSSSDTIEQRGNWAPAELAGIPNASFVVSVIEQSRDVHRLSGN
jgi:hypothetical protein